MKRHSHARRLSHGARLNARLTPPLPKLGSSAAGRLGLIASLGLSALLCAPIGASAESCDLDVATLGDPTLRCKLFEPTPQLDGLSSTEVNVPARFNFQARLSQAKLPLGDRSLPRVAIRFYNLQDQLVCATERSDVIVSQSVLNLQLKEEELGGCKLAQLMASYPELKIKVCLGDQNCLRPIKLSSVPYALKSEFTYWAKSAHRAERASVSHYTQQLSADRDLLNTIQKDLPGNATGYFSASHHQLTSLPATAGFPEVTVPSSHPSNAGALLWNPQREQSSTLHISSKDPQRDELRHLARVAWVADRSLIAGDLVIEGLTVGERRDGLQVQEGDLYLRNPLSVDAGLVVKGEALSQEHPMPVDANTQEVPNTALSPLALDPTYALSVGDVNNGTLNESGTPLRVTGATSVQGRLSVGQSLELSGSATVTGSSAIYGRLSTSELTVMGLNLALGDLPDFTPPPPVLSLNVYPPSTERRPALSMSSLTTTPFERVIRGQEGASSLTLNSGDLHVKGQVEVEGDSSLSNSLSLGAVGDGASSGFALHSLLMSYQREALNELSGLTHTSALLSADLLSLKIGDADNKLVVRGETRIRGNVTFTQPPVLLGGCHIRIPGDQEGLPISTVERFSLVCGEQAVTLRPFRCGNSRIDPGEQCDEGDLVDGDGCSSHCLCEPENLIDGVYFRPGAPGGDGDTLNACSGNLCGNGSVDIGEQCDDANNHLSPCENCRLPACGNGIKSVDSNGVPEGCDDGNLIDGDGCSSLCQLERNTITLAEDTVYSFNDPNPPLFTNVPIDHIVRCTQPSNGALSDPLDRVNNQEGTAYKSAASYSPEQDFNGNDSFNCDVISPSGSIRSSSTFLMTVTPVNDAPTADAVVSVTTPEDVTLSSISLNVNDVDGDTLTVSCDPALKGTVTVNANNTLRYQPTANDSGEDSFVCRTSDGELEVSTAVTISITPVNDAPNISGGPITTAEDTLSTANLITLNDVETAVANLSLTCQNGAKGVVTVDQVAKTVTYSPNLNQNGADSFTCSVTDQGDGPSAALTTTATISVSITPVNDAPTALANVSITTSEDTPSAATSINATDVDGDALTITCVAGSKGTAVQTANNTITYTPTLNQNGADSFTCTTSDGNGGSVSTTVSVTISAVNDAPTALANVSITTSEDTPSGATSINAADVDGDALTITCVAGSKGTAVQTANNTITYTPNPNQNGADSFTCTTSDGNGGSASTTVSVTITAVNDVPTALANVSITTNEDTPSGATTINAADVDGDTLTITCAAGSKGAAVQTANNTITYTPTLNQNGADSFTCTTSDGNGGSVSTTVSVTITAVNDAPTAFANVSITTNEDTPSAATTINAADVDGDTLTITCEDGSKGAAAQSANNTITYTPTLNQNGADTFTCTTSDGNGGSVSTAVSVTITAVNDDPEANDDSINTGVSSTVNVLTNDTDVDGDSLSLVSCLTSTTQASDPDLNVTTNGVNAGNVTYSGTTSGTYTYTCTVSDGEAQATSTLTVTVP